MRAWGRLGFVGVVLSLLCAPAPLEGAREVDLTVRPRWILVAGSAYGTFHALVRVPRHNGNRLLVLVWDGPAYASRAIQLNTSLEWEDQQVFEFYQSLPEGVYAVTALLVRVVDGKQRRYVATQTVSVCGTTIDTCIGLHRR